MNYTSYEVSKRLWEVGLILRPFNEFGFHIHESTKEPINILQKTSNFYMGYYPCYDLGELIREIASQSDIDALNVTGNLWHISAIKINVVESDEMEQTPFFVNSDTPEDAAAELLIKILAEKQ